MCYISLNWTTYLVPTVNKSPPKLYCSECIHVTKNAANTMSLEARKKEMYSWCPSWPA